MYYKLNIEDFVMTALSCVVKRDCKLFICKGVVMGGILSLNIDCKLKSSLTANVLTLSSKAELFAESRSSRTGQLSPTILSSVRDGSEMSLW